MITCYKCGREVPAAHANRRHVCRSCRLTYNREYYHRHRAQLAQAEPEPLDLEYPERVTIPEELAPQCVDLLAGAYQVLRRSRSKRAREWLTFDWPKWAEECGIRPEFLERIGA